MGNWDLATITMLKNLNLLTNLGVLVSHSLLLDLDIHLLLHKEAMFILGVMLAEMEAFLTISHSSVLLHLLDMQKVEVSKVQDLLKL